MSNIDIPVWIPITLNFKNEQATVVRDSYDIPTLIDRMEFDIPKWMEANVRGAWGSLQFEEDVYYWFEHPEEAAHFKLVWCE